MKRAKLIIASSESDSDMLYASGFHAPDPFVFVELEGRKTLLLNDLEVDRGRANAAVDEVLAFSDLERALQGRRRRRPTTAEVVAYYLQGRGVRHVSVPDSFPLGLARALERCGVSTHPEPPLFWPDREFKTASEIRLLKASAKIAEIGMATAFEVLRSASIGKNGILQRQGTTLTSESVRAEIESAVLRAGGQARMDSIVACGEQACDPHARGHGPLRANELIILDIFPRCAASGYYGDITRTVVRGRATPAQRTLWKLCLRVQKDALRGMRPGAVGQQLQDEAREKFAQAGYTTEVHGGRWRGFFHGLGHGLGLDIHEHPRLASTTLRVGQVVTVEPGLYWPGIGGVRHEDVVAVTTRGHQLLTSFPKPMEI